MGLIAKPFSPAWLIEHVESVLSAQVQSRAATA
jgi:hypothetical protein